MILASGESGKNQIKFLYPNLNHIGQKSTGILDMKGNAQIPTQMRFGHLAEFSSRSTETKRVPLANPSSSQAVETPTPVPSSKIVPKGRDAARARKNAPVSSSHDWGKFWFTASCFSRSSFGGAS